MKKSIETILDSFVQNCCAEAGVKLPDNFSYDLHPPKEAQHGDLACNVAFKLSKILRKKPAEIAETIVTFIEKMGAESPVDRMDIAGAGFINFHLRKADLGAVIVNIHNADKKFGCSEYGKGKKVVVEFVSANPTGPLTIAHGRQAAVGDALVRILKASGHEAYPEYYLNDGGRQMRMLALSVWARYNELLGISTVPFPEDGYKGDYIGDMARDIIEKEKKDSLLKESEEKAVEYCGHYAVKTMMAWIEADLAKMRVHFENYFSEKSLYETKAVDRALDVLKQKGFLFESEGALWFRSTDFGDDKDRVIRKSTGEYTYLTPDIAYHLSKYERGFNVIVNFWGPDHHGYIPRLKAACQALGYPPEAIHIGIVQLTTLYRDGQPVRMSTRAGEFVTLRELYEEVGVDATRFFFIMRRQESPLDFDLDLAKAQSQENPVYYLQYAHARIASLLKYGEQKITADADTTLLASIEEADLIRTLSEFPDMVIAASRLLEPYRLADYLRQVAASFHKFYSAHRIVTEDKELTKSRLLLSDAARIVLRNGLELLGISQPESM